MKTSITYKCIISLIALIIIAGCSKEYEERAFKQHLMVRINEAIDLRDKAVIGAEEDEYKSGSKEPLTATIEEATAVYWNVDASQQLVDDAYASLNDKMFWFNEQKNPQKSVMYSLIEYCKTLIRNTLVGAGDGQIPSQSFKDGLQAAINAAETFMSSNPGMTPSELAIEYNKLQEALLQFEGNLQGKTSLLIVNHSFEEPGSPDDSRIYDFGAIPGWESAGPLYADFIGNESWATPNYITSASIKSDGSYSMWITNYYKQIWQVTSEALHTDSRYTLTVDAGSTGAHADLRLRMELLVFTEQEGDFSHVKSLKAQEITGVGQMLTMEPQTLYLDVVPSLAEYKGKKLVITLRGYITKPWESVQDAGFVWNAAAVGVDNVRLTREKWDSAQ